jgi:hypothetical protein
MTTEKDSNQSESDFLHDPIETISEGAKIFSEKASEIFSTFFEKVKETSEAALEKGGEIYEEVSLKSQGYLEKFRDRTEMAKLKDQRDEVAKELGYMCFMEYAGRYRFRVEFLKSDEFKKLMAQVRALDKQIIQIGERLEA